MKKDNQQKKYICENPKCQKEHDGSYGSGRFCSEHCRRVVASIKANATMKKNGTKKCNFTCQQKHSRKPYGTWQCKCCNLIFNTRQQLRDHNRKFHPIQKGSSWNKGLTKETDPRVASYVQTCKDLDHYKSPFKGKHLFNKHKSKTSKTLKKYLKEHPDKVPYLLNHSSKESYPEQYFRTAFINEDFPIFVQDKYVEGYFLDFAFEKQKVYIEVDGEQHFTDKRIVEHDKIRQNILDLTEWKCICRIRWSTYQKLDNNQKHIFLMNLKTKILFG